MGVDEGYLRIINTVLMGVERYILTRKVFIAVMVYYCRN